MKKSSVVNSMLPVLFGFFVMGFCDVVGIATSYVKVDFSGQLPAGFFGFLPSVVFLWFLLLSVPTAMVMNRIGRKNTVLLSALVTAVGMLIPYVYYNLITCIIGFALLGIGNTIIQVSLNPLLSNVVNGARLTSALTGGQVVKAVSSFCGPFIALFAAQTLGNWQYLFPIFAGITVLSGLWLAVTPVVRENSGSSTSVGQTFALLKDRRVLLLFLGIAAVVGVDVGMNTEAPMLLMERLGLDPTLEESVRSVGYAPSVYFACRTVGAFVGTFLLARVDSMKYFRTHMLLALAAVSVLVFAHGELLVLGFVGLVGYACSSIFPIIYSMAIQARPEKANEISGLMITGVFGGAVVPPLMTICTSIMGERQVGALIVIGLAVVYLIYCSFGIKIKTSSSN